MSKNTSQHELQQIIAVFQRGDFSGAYRRGMELLKKSARDKALLEVVGVSASKLGQLPNAEKYLRKAIKLAPNRPSLHQALAETFQQDNRLDEAMVEFERAGALDPDSVFPIAGKATVLERRGEAEAAIDLLLPIVDNDKSGFAASVMATALQSLGRYDETIQQIEDYLIDPTIDHRIRMSMCRTIAKAYEKKNDYNSAFSALTQSNKIMARPFDRLEYKDRIDNLIATFSEQNLSMLSQTTRMNERPVFIACMPRSGSTLVEQIVHAHPKCYGAGEITDIAEIVRNLPASLGSIQMYPDCLGDWTKTHADRIQRGYLDSLRDYNSSASRVTNKHLDNDLHLGMIALLFPGAKVLQTRRDPLDNCFSIFMAAMHTDSYPWSTDLADIAFVFVQHQRLMTHWQSVLNLDFHEISYESLVKDPEPEIRGIINHLGLQWDDRCLKFNESKRDVATLSYDQIRRPIYNSAVGRWKRYEEHLSPLIDALDSLAE